MEDRVAALEAWKANVAGPELTTLRYDVEELRSSVAKVTADVERIGDRFAQADLSIRESAQLMVGTANGIKNMVGGIEVKLDSLLVPKAGNGGI